MKCCRLPNYFSVLIISLVSVWFGLDRGGHESDGFVAVQETENQESNTKSSNSKEAADEEAFAPIDNMHHFMEYICEPSYKGLKQVLATEPADRKAWKVFKNHALVLAETSALVAERGPEKEAEAKQWNTIALAVYKHGKDLYKSSGKYDDAKKHYGLMIDNCNKCHTVFAKGKYQLAK